MFCDFLFSFRFRQKKNFTFEINESNLLSRTAKLAFYSLNYPKAKIKVITSIA